MQTLKKGSLSINEFVVKMKGITDSLIAAGQSITEYNLISYVLEGVWQKFDPVVVAITARKREITMQDAQFLLMSFESRLEQFAYAGDLSKASVNVHVTSQRGDSSNYQRGNC